MLFKNVNWYARVACLGAIAPILVSCASQAGTEPGEDVRLSRDALVLPKPDAISCQGDKRDTVRISWRDAATDETNYRVERQIGTGGWSEIKVADPNTTFFDDLGADVSQQNRHYRVRSFRASDNTFSAYSDVCNNRRIFESAHFRVFYGLRATTDECPQIDGKDVCLQDKSDAGMNVFIKRISDSLEGSIAAFDRVGFRPGSAGTPPAGNDKIPINVIWCDGGGCAGGGGLGLSPELLEKNFDLATRVGDPVSWLVGLHEAFHFQEYQYSGINDPDWNWLAEGQARSIQDKLCIGADRATCNSFDDIATGAYGYVPELKGYLSNTKQSLVHASYQSVLFWTYLTEKYGTSSPADTVEGGMNFLVKFWEATSASPGGDGIAGVNNALIALGSPKRFRDVWEDFAVASYAKDLSGPGVQAKYKYADMAQPGGAYGSVTGASISSDVLNPGTQVVKTGINLLPWSAHYYELRPTAAVPVIDLKVLQDSTVPVYYTVLGIKGTDVTYEFNVEARSLDKTLINNAYDRVVVVVAGLENSANYRVSFNGSLPTLTIRTPLSSTPVRVGDPAAPDKFRVAVEVIGANGTPLAGVDRSMFNFKVGTNVVPVAGVINSATVQGQQWFIVQAPAQATASAYDLQVSYGTLTATATQAVSYSPVTTSDSVITIDRSGSMSFNNKLVSAQDAARLYVDSWHAGDKVGVVSFNDMVATNLNLTDWTNTAPDGGSRQLAFNAINGLTASGNTAIGDAVRQSWNNLTAGGAPAHDWAVVLLSDGLSNAGTETFQTVIAALKASTAKKPVVHAIALGPDADQALMQQAASDTGGTYQFVSAPADSALRTLALTAPSDMGLDLHARYRVVASKIARQQQVFTSTGPISDNDPVKDVVTIPIESGASELVLSLSWNGGSVGPTLKTPGATAVAPFETTGTHSVWRIPTPAAGAWQLTVEKPIIVPTIARAAALSEGESLPPYLVHAALRSSLLMDTYLPTALSDRIPGVSMPILVSLTGAGPVAGASVTAGVQSPSGVSSSLTLLDDGQHGDGAANDGLYGATFQKTSEPGSYGLTIDAAGTSAITGAFARQDLSSFFLNGGGDSDGDHLPDTWEVSHGTNPNIPDSTADDDTDGADNETEWQNGTDPKNADTDGGGETDGTDSNPLDPTDDRLQSTTITAYPGAGKVYVRYVVRPNYTRTTLLRSTSVNGPFTVILSAFPGAGMFTDSTVTNGTNYCYRVNGFDAAGRQSAPQTPSCTTPKADPVAPHGMININKGQRVAVSTNVTLTLWASDAVDPESTFPGDPVPPAPSSSASGVKEMLISNRSDLSDGVWQPYATSKPWVLAAASGLKTVYVKYRDNAGNESPVTSATINLVPLATSVCTPSPLGTANGFNLFSFGNVSQSATDTQGRVAVGGNATFTNYSVGSALGNSNGTRDDLIVDSRLSYTNGTVYKGNITYGSSATLSAVNLPHGTSRQAHPLSFPAEQLKLELESTAWGTLPATGTTTVQYFGGPTAQITLTGTKATLNVFTISGTDFSAANSLTIKAPAGSTVLVNITGATPQMKNFGTSFVGTDKQHVLYNFFEANTLTVSGIAVQGSILAPFAAVTFTSGSIDGTLISSSLIGPGQAHLFLFQGCAPVPQLQ